MERGKVSEKQRERLDADKKQQRRGLGGMKVTHQDNPLVVASEGKLGVLPMSTTRTGREPTAQGSRAQAA
jgi:hypothetical protein